MRARIRELGSRFMDAGDGKPRIYVSKRCVKWIQEVMAFDAEFKENDHAVDATRYAVMGRHRGPIQAYTAKRPW